MSFGPDSPTAATVKPGATVTSTWNG
jgi:hypothetical protein